MQMSIEVFVLDINCQSILLKNQWMVVIAICAFYLLSMLTSMICRKNIYKHQRFFWL